MTRTATITVNKTVTVKKVKAKHFANQAGLDRLQELLIKATSNPNGGQNYAQTIRRAFKSLQECKEPVLTQKDAMKLKYIGPAMAKRICPQSTGVEVGGPKPTKSKATKSKQSASNAKNNCENDENTLPSSIVANVGELYGSTRPPAGLSLVCPRPAISASQGTSAVVSSCDPVATSKEAAYESAKAEAEQLVLPPRGPWKVTLLVDGREHKSKQVVSSCKQAGIPCEERHLAIGDMAWIARCVVPNENETSDLTHSAETAAKKRKKKDKDKYRTIEILVGTIIERKEVSDLAMSLFGTRYAEQRLRLSQCGLPQVLFLVEGNLSSLTNCPAETLQMAMMETRINLGFQIIQTKHLTDTVSILKTLHSRIVQRTFPDAFGKSSTGGASQVLPTFGGGNKRKGGRGNRRASSLLELVFDSAPNPPFGTKRFITYQELKAKVELDRERGTRSVRAITLAMLKQIPTLSQKKCTAIANRYPTLNRLLNALAYPEALEPNGTNLNRKKHPKKIVQDIVIDSGRRSLGPSSASEVYAACCTLQDGSTVISHTEEKAAFNRSVTSFFPSIRSFDCDDGKKPRATMEAKADAVIHEKLSLNCNNNVPPQSLESIIHSSSGEAPRAFSKRKRHAPTAVASQAVPSTSENDIHSGINSPPRSKRIQQHDPIDLLTPEPTPNPIQTSPRVTEKMNLSNWSNSSNGTCVNKRYRNSNGAISSKVIANAAATSMVRSKSKLNSIDSASTRDGTSLKSTTKTISKTSTSVNRTLALSSDEDSPFSIAIATNNIMAKGTSTTVYASLPTKKRVSENAERDQEMVFSTDEDESPFRGKLNTKDSIPKHDSNTKNIGLVSKSQTTPNSFRTATKVKRMSMASESSQDGSTLFSSPDASTIDTRFSSEKKNLGETNKTDNDNENRVVCLLDDSDDEDNHEIENGVAQKVFNEPSNASETMLSVRTQQRSLVTTKRGGALHSTQESACSIDDDSSASSTGDLELGESLLKRLGTIQGRNLQEVIELDSD